MTEFQEAKSNYNEFWLTAHESWQSYQRTLQVALNGYAGRTWTQAEIDKLSQEGRVPQEYNLIRPQVNFFSGYARDNMKSTIIGPQEGGDQKTADELSEVVKHVYEKGQANRIILDCFDESLKVGMSIVEMYLDFTNDPVHGDIKYKKRDANAYLIDPLFKKKDLSDASDILMREFMTKDDAKLFYPYIDEDLIEDVPFFSSDGKFRLLEKNNLFLKKRNVISVDQHFVKTIRKVKHVVDLNTGISRPLIGNAEFIKFHEERAILAKEMGANIAIREFNRPFVELNVIMSGQVVFSGPPPIGLESYPLAPIFCYLETQIVNQSDLMVQGVSVGLIDTNRMFNKRMMREDDIMDSALNSGGLYHPSAISAKDLVEQTGAAKYIPVDDEWEFANAFQPLQMGSPPPGFENKRDFLFNMPFRIAGIPESTQGFDEGGNSQVSGRLAEVRAANGVRSNRGVFDNLEYAQKLIGNKTMQGIQLNYGSDARDDEGVRIDTGKITRILGNEPTEDFFNLEFDQYDSNVKLAVLSQTQRDSLYFELVRLAETWGPDKVPLSLVFQNLPIEGASEIQEAIEAQEQAAQQQQQVLEEERQRKARLEEAMINQQNALAQNRRARIFSEIGREKERVSEIRQNLASANLDQAKTLTEIDKLNNENFMQLVQFLEFLKQREEQEQNIDQADNEQLATQVLNLPESSGQQSQQLQQFAEQQNQGV